MQIIFKFQNFDIKTNDKSHVYPIVSLSHVFLDLKGCLKWASDEYSFTRTMLKM